MQFSDLSSPAFYTDPYPLYQQLRNASTLVNLAPKIWVTGRYAICDAVLRDRRMGRNYMGGIQARYGEEYAKAPVFRTFERMMLLINPPDHTRLRTLLMKSFNATQEARFKQLTRTIADRLIDRFAQTKSIDIMRDYATPLPLEVICTLLNVPFEDMTIFSNVVRDLAQTLELAPMKKEQIDAANLAIATLENYFALILYERRKHPGEDLISRLLLAEDNDRLTEEEILANIILLFMAGHETTSNMIGNALIALHRHPQQLAQAIENVSLLPGVVSECLRYDGSVQLSARSALEDIEIEGVPIARGNTVFLFLGAANRDPDKFLNPDSLMIGRTTQDARLLAFGGGLHHCLGARLATIELEIALGALFRRLPNMRISNLDSLRWHQRNALRGVDSLIATW